LSLLVATGIYVIFERRKGKFPLLYEKKAEKMTILRIILNYKIDIFPIIIIF
jgi:hypothetical protein